MLDKYLGYRGKKKRKKKKKESLQFSHVHFRICSIARGPGAGARREELGWCPPTPETRLSRELEHHPAGQSFGDADCFPRVGSGGQPWVQLPQGHLWQNARMRTFHSLEAEGGRAGIWTDELAHTTST